MGYRWSSTSRVRQHMAVQCGTLPPQDLHSANFPSSPPRRRPAVQPYLLTVYPLGLALVWRTSGSHAWPPFCQALKRNMTSRSWGTGCRCQRVEAKVHPRTHLCCRLRWSRGGRLSFRLWLTCSIGGDMHLCQKYVPPRGPWSHPSCGWGVFSTVRGADGLDLWFRR